MRQRYDDLEQMSLQPRVVYSPKEILITQTVPARVAHACDQFYEMNHRHTNLAIKTLVFSILQFNIKCNKLMKISSHCKLPIIESNQ